MKKQSKVFGPLCIILAAFSWGIFPAFSRWLYSMQVDSITVAAMRTYISGIIYLIIGLFIGLFRSLKWKDIIFFSIFGFITITCTYTCYLTAMQQLSIAMASILLYTAPIFIAIFSRIIFKEQIDRQTALILLVTLAGCFLVVKGYDFASLQGNLFGILMGIGSALGYAAMTLLGRYGLSRYTSAQNAMLPVIFGAVFFLFIRPPWSIPMSSLSMFAGYSGVAVLGCVLPVFLYMHGMALGVPGTQASIMATIEPVVATIIGAMMGDNLEILQIVGIVITLGSATLPAVLTLKNKA